MAGVFINESGRPPCNRLHAHQHTERAAEACAETGCDKGFKHRQCHAVDQRFANAQQTRRERAGNDLLHAEVFDLFGLEVDGNCRAHLASACHCKHREQRDAAHALKLHRINRDQAVVQAEQNHWQEECGEHEARDNRDNRVARVDEHREALHEPVGYKARSRHDGHYEEDRDHQKRDKRSQDQVENIRDVFAYKFLHFGQDPNAEDDANDTALAGREDGFERNIRIVQAKGCGDRDNLRHDGHCTEHTAKRRGCAELSGRADAGIDGKVGQEAAADEFKQRFEQEQKSGARLDLLFGGRDLSDQARKAVEQAGCNDGRQHRDKDIRNGAHGRFKFVLFLAGFHLCFVVLPVFGHRTGLHANGAAEQVGYLLGLSGAQDDLKRLVFHNTEHAFGLFERVDLCQGRIMQFHAQPGHTVGR